MPVCASAQSAVILRRAKNRYVPIRSPIGFDFRLLRRAKFVAPPPSSPPSSPVDFADLRRCIDGVLPTDPGVAAGAIEGVRPIEPGVRSARSDAIVASFVGGELRGGEHMH